MEKMGEHVKLRAHVDRNTQERKDKVDVYEEEKREKSRPVQNFEARRAIIEGQKMNKYSKN